MIKAIECTNALSWLEKLKQNGGLAGGHFHFHYRRNSFTWNIHGSNFGAEVRKILIKRRCEGKRSVFKIQTLHARWSV
jgi:hypothetical protein